MKALRQKKIFLGTLPTHELLTQNNLREFRPIVHAIRTGNLGLMEDALAKYEFFFVRTGIYLLGTRFHTLSIETLPRENSANETW